MSSNQYSQSLSTSDIVLTDWMVVDDETTNHLHPQMEALDDYSWKPQRPYILPLLINHVIHIRTINHIFPSPKNIISGPLRKFSINRNGHYSIIIFDKHPYTLHEHTICSNLIHSVYIDHTHTTKRNLQTIYQPLLRKLNTDVIHQIYSYLQTDFLYL